MQQPRRIRRAVIAATGAALVLAGAAGANAVGGPQPGTSYAVSPANPADAVNAAMPPGSELQFVAVAPCRIVDTRKAGGKLSASSRTFDATLASYASQGGKAGTCNVPDIAMAVELNLGAISTDKKSSYLVGWAAGEPEPTASMINTNPAGPIANMVTMPVNALGQFTLKTPGGMDVFADVAGYYVQPLYATINAEENPTAPVVNLGVSSGLVSVDTYSENGTVLPGFYTLTFDRNVTACAAAATEFSFAGTHSISVETTFLGDSSILVSIKDAAGDPAGTIFHITLTC
jgi:hypothetical protein